MSAHDPRQKAPPELDKQAKELIGQFGKALQAELMQALAQGGPEVGIAVCRERANTMAIEMAPEGWQISRVSLKNRNPNNAPDEWEETVLKTFEQQLNDGADTKSLYTSATQGKRFRAMKAIPIKPVCLACHGGVIPGSVQDTLDMLYSDDKATGYELGQLRGAFSVVKTLEDTTLQ